MADRSAVTAYNK